MTCQYPELDSAFDWLKQLNISSGGSRGGARGTRAPLFLDQTEGRRAEKFFKTVPLISESGWPGPPLSEGLDPPLISNVSIKVL